MIICGDFRLFIDRVEIGDELRIEGWCFHEQGAPCRLGVLIDHDPQPRDAFIRQGGDRRDVALALDAPAAALAGFTLVMLLPLNAAAVRLQISGGGAQETISLLARDGLSLRSWRAACDYGPGQLDYRFFTERGLRYAAASPRSLNRAQAALGAFSSAPPTGPAIRPVTVIIPVYGGKPFLYKLAQSLLDSVPPPHTLIFIDDGNPDQTISAFLTALAVSHDHVLLIRKTGNEGYLRAVTDGFTLAGQRNPDSHVVLVNSDVEVPAGWLERLLAPIERDPGVASVTPLSNAGTICGFPAMPDDNDPFLGLTVDDIDGVFRGLTAPPVELPTGVGFCMAFNRRALNEIGFFDQQAFGRGYGEEVDWCRRALQRGYVHVAAPNLYVHHKHGGSFSQTEKTAQLEISGRVIQTRYPDFDAEVQDFIKADPLRPLRAAAALLLAGRHGRPVALMFDHGADGGAATFRRQEIARQHAAGRAVMLVQPNRRAALGAPDGAIDISLLSPGLSLESPSDAQQRFSANDLSDLSAAVATVKVGEVIINSLVGYAGLATLAAWIEDLARRTNAPMRILHHDYFPICPSLNLIDAEDRYCGVPSPERCRVCVPANRHFRRPDDPAASHFDPAYNAAFDLPAHRRVWESLFALAERHVFFSKSALAVMTRAFALREGTVRIIPHLIEHMTVTRPLFPPPAQGPGGRVAVIGGVNVAKGSLMLGAMARLAAAYQLPLYFELFGNIDHLVESSHFHDNGTYQPEDLPRLLGERDCRAVFLPAIWPETYCYVLDEVIGLGLPVGAFDIGAPAERLRLWPNGFVVAETTPEAALSTLLQVLGKG